MPTIIDTPLLVVGGGPAALIVATTVAGYSLSSLVVGHEAICGDEAVELDQEVIELLKPHGVLNVLLPYATSTDPLIISAAVFEQVLKHHCVVNMNITLYDGMDLMNVKEAGNGASCTISDGHTEWAVKADHLVDTAAMPTDLNAAIREGAAVARNILKSV